MILEQYYLGCLSQASYLIGDETSGEAAVVDPRRDVDEYVAEATRRGLRITHVFETHFHADFVSGHLELASRTGAPIHFGRRAAPSYPCELLGDGDVISLGGVEIEVMETPGHTPESVCLVVRESSAGPPHAVLTGDTLFIGDVGRPDLLSAAGLSSAEMARDLYRSVQRLLAQPDATLVYPAHGAGSACGKSLSQETVSTIGEQRRFNYACQPMPEAEFVALVTEGQPDQPAYFGYDARVNREGYAPLADALAHVTPLSADGLAARLGEVVVLDVRDPATFPVAHVRGSVNVGLDGRFAEYAGSVIAPGTPIVLVAEPGTERDSALRLGRVGIDSVVGYLDGGVDGLADRADLVATATRLDAPTLAAVLAAPDPPLVVDVRAQGEWELGHIDDAMHVPLARLAERADTLPRDRRLAVICGSGYRSSVAASWLRRAGFDDVVDVVGGMNAWRALVPV